MIGSRSTKPQKPNPGPSRLPSPPVSSLPTQKPPVRRPQHHRSHRADHQNHHAHQAGSQPQPARRLSFRGSALARRAREDHRSARRPGPPLGAAAGEVFRFPACEVRNRSPCLLFLPWKIPEGSGLLYLVRFRFPITCCVVWSCRNPPPSHRQSYTRLPCAQRKAELLRIGARCIAGAMLHTILVGRVRFC